MKFKLRPSLVLIAYVATVTVNALANIIPFNGKTTGAISDSFPVYFVPAGYVFGIWGLIYLLVGVYAVYQSLPLERGSRTLDWIGKLFVVGSIANITWILLWHYGYTNYTIIAMGILLLTLVISYRTIRKRKREHEIGRWVVRVPFSIYLGWITVATIANATVVLYNVQWDGFGISGPVWSAILTALATLVGVLMIAKERDVAYAGVILWAVIGIYVKFHSTQPVIGVTTLICSGILLIAIIVQAIQAKKKR